MFRRAVVLVLGLVLALGASACSDPNSPVDPRCTPHAGEVRAKHANRYGDVQQYRFYYLRIAFRSGTCWTQVEEDVWRRCAVGDRWNRILGCWSSLGEETPAA